MINLSDIIAILSWMCIWRGLVVRMRRMSAILREAGSYECLVDDLLLQQHSLDTPLIPPLVILHWGSGSAQGRVRSHHLLISCKEPQIWLDRGRLTWLVKFCSFLLILDQFLKRWGTLSVCTSLHCVPSLSLSHYWYFFVGITNLFTANFNNNFSFLVSRP